MAWVDTQRVPTGVQQRLVGVENHAGVLPDEVSDVRRVIEQATNWLAPLVELARPLPTAVEGHLGGDMALEQGLELTRRELGA